jgi:hypothetical protein
MCRGPLPYGHAGATRIFSDSACSFAARRRANDHTNEQEQRCDRYQRRREQREPERPPCGLGCVLRAACGRRRGHDRPAHRDPRVAHRGTTSLEQGHRCARVRQQPRRDRADAEMHSRPKRPFDCRDRQAERQRGIARVVDQRREVRLDDRGRRRSRRSRRERRDGQRGHGSLDHRRRDRRPRQSGGRPRLRGRQRRRSDGFHRGRRDRRYRFHSWRSGRRVRTRRDGRRLVGHGSRRRRRRRGVRARSRSRRRLDDRRCRQGRRRRSSRGGRRRGSRGQGRGRRRREQRQQAERVEVALVVRVQADAQVNVRNVELGRPARADRPHRRTLREDGALRDVEGAEMRERDGERVSREDRDALTARGHRPGERHLSGRRRDDRRSRRGADVDAAVLATRVRVRRIERERREHRAGHGPRPRARGRDPQQRIQHHHNRPHDDSLLLSRWKTRRADASDGVGCCQF